MNTNNKKLWLYSSLDSVISHLPFFKSYEYKIMLIAFLGTHVPLLALLIHFLLSNSYDLSTTINILLVALLATLVGTGITLYILHQLLAPVSLTSQALQAYINEKEIPKLPINYTDEVGTLMADTVNTIKKLDGIIEHLTNYDQLTGLPNRVLFIDRLQQALSRSQNKNLLLAVVCIHLPNLREINKALGSSAGEHLLRAMAQRLNANVGRTEFICRLSSDEFAIALPDLKTSEDVLPLCQILQTTLVSPVVLYGKEVHPEVSLGIAVYPFDGSSIEQIIQNANTASDEAKHSTVNNYQFFGAEMNTQLKERLVLEGQLRYALERHEFELHYQPRIDTNASRVISVEALLRWQNQQLGAVSPVKFIPLAEANGLIIPIGEWVLRTACNQNLIWQKAGLPPLRVAVNLSARQLAQPDIVAQIANILEQTGLNPKFLELEVTESLIMENVQQTIKVLQQFHEMGITLALDDFGTGYSSLNYLRRFPIDILKIDRSFVRDIVNNPEDAAVTNTIITLAKNLQLHITAEGVETQEQYEYLKAQGCHEIQGYYFSRPVPAVAMTEFLQQYRDN